MKRLLDPFIFALIAAIFVAWLFPSLGIERNSINPSAIANWGVGVIFFFYGLKLNGSKLKAGLKNGRLHILIQLSTFILFPLLVWPFMPAEPNTLWLGVFFVACLPSTVSSSVVMVSLARGNIAGAIFNASLSSLLGVAITPLLMSLYLSGQAGSAPLGDVLIGLVFQVIVPICLGMGLNRWWGEWAEKTKGMLRIFDQTVIIAIVWTSFCEGFSSGIFQSVSWEILLWLIVGMSALFFGAYGIILLLCKLLKFNREDRITALFCGSKKSLVHGTVISKVLVSNSSMTALLILPIMIYHALQLVFVSVIAKTRQNEKMQ